MNTVNNIVLEFLRSSNTQKLLANYEFDELFKAWSAYKGSYGRGNSEIRSMLESVSVNPLDYMTYVPECYHYEDADLESITIPSRITYIDDNAFYECSHLKRIDIPNDVTSIGDAAFSDCGKLTEISLPKGLTKLGSWCFHGAGLERIIIPGSIKVLESRTFGQNSSLEEVKVEEGVEIIENSRFECCDALTKVELPRSIKHIQEDVFFSCSKLEQITFKGTSSEWRAITKGKDWAQNSLKHINCSNKTLRRNVK